MRLSLCLVTNDVAGLSAFYAELLKVPATGDSTYVEFRPADDWVLALCDAAALDAATPGVHSPASNRSARIELEVDDADTEFERMRPHTREVVVAPTSWPWGTRAAWIRDPDGNLVSLYSVA